MIWKPGYPGNLSCGIQNNASEKFLTISGLAANNTLDYIASYNTNTGAVTYDREPASILLNVSVNDELLHLKLVVPCVMDGNYMGYKIAMGDIWKLVSVQIESKCLVIYICLPTWNTTKFLLTIT